MTSDIVVVAAAFAGGLVGGVVGSVASMLIIARAGDRAAALEANRRAQEAREFVPPPLPTSPNQCQGRPGCTVRPVTVRHFHGGGTQRLCAACADDPETVPPDKRMPGTPGATPGGSQRRGA